MMVLPPVRTVDRVMADARASAFTTRSVKGQSKRRALLLAMSILDLTTLEGKDTPERVRTLCRKAARPAPDDERVLGYRVPAAGAVCVYPAFVGLARRELAGTGVRVASVATGFPSGQYPLEVRLEDTRRALADGADEIDMVINRGAFLGGRLEEVAEEIARVADICCQRATGSREERAERANQQSSTTAKPQVRTWREPDNGSGLGEAKGDSTEARNGTLLPHSSSSVASALSAFSSPAHLKVILETGELETYDNVRRASDLATSVLSAFAARHAGFVGFIKTSTGKVQPAATMGVTLVMLEAVRDEFLRTGRVIGVKPAGGIRTAKQAVQYLVMVRETVGGLRDSGGRCPWLTPEYFRFGASTLANDLLRQVYRLGTGRYMAGWDFSEG